MTQEAEKRNKAICTLSGVCKTYRRGAVSVLRDVSLTVCAGEVTGIRGRNGAGKSTLIELMAGVAKADGGSVTYAEGVQGHIGYVPQELSLYESLTVTQNLNFWGRAQGLHGKSLRDRRRMLLEALDLTAKKRARVETLSGGMKRRVHLATALIATPKLLLLDEPTVGADLESSARILHLLERARTEGCGIVLVSHISEDFTQLCDHVFTITDGYLE